MTERFSLAGLFVSVLVVAAAYASAFTGSGPAAWAPWLMALGTSGALVSVMALGAARRGHLGRLIWPLSLVFLILAGSFAAALALPAEEGAATLWLGLPPRAAVILYGLGFLPLVIVPLAYALTFDDRALTEADWERVLSAARARRESTVESRGEAA